MIDRDFRVGDRVTCNMYGLGEVIEIDDDYVNKIVEEINNFIKGEEK